MTRTYFYHFKFELYPTPTPHIPTNPNSIASASPIAPNVTTSAPSPVSQQQGEIYLPPLGADIFDSTAFPAHAYPRADPDAERNSTSTAKAKTHTRSTSSGYGSSGSSDNSKENVSGRILGSGLPPRGQTIIDCGPERAQVNLAKAGREREGIVGQIIHKDSAGSGAAAAIRRSRQRKARLAVEDWRFGRVRIESIDMANVSDGGGRGASAPTATAGIGRRKSIHGGPRSHGAKARFEPLPPAGVKNTEVGWGIVHLYRDGEESTGSMGMSPAAATTTPSTARVGVGEGKSKSGAEEGEEGGIVEGAEENTTILCIPAVPSYMTPSDFLGWVGEKTREEVSHFRMVMTGHMNRYLVLLKFRDAKVARLWRAEWDGKVFGGLEPENCHVMFIRSIIFETPSEQASESFPYMSHDPFTPSLGTTDAAVGPSLALKPFPPPTPSLVELPTCPVCLERMDDTTGLLTILCQHVFHCACLSKWRGSGCPVCRHTQPYPSLNQPFGASVSDLCRVCDCPDDLWICLICGHVGCGRYKGGHAKEHWKETAHNYALEIETQHVWDYAGDLWVHRLIQTKGDGKLVELPSNSRPAANGFGGLREEIGEGVEMVPRAKLENIGIEYTHLLTSQLESQRVYFEDVVKKAVDKSSSASKAAEAASAKAEEALAALRSLELEHARLRDDVIPSLEREQDRLKTKAEKSSEIARSMTSKWQEEKKVGEGLMQRVKHVNEGIAGLSRELAALRAENEDLKEQNRDLGFFISGKERLQALAGEGQVGGEEVLEGTVSLPPVKETKGKGKGRGKGLGK